MLHTISNFSGDYSIPQQFALICFISSFFFYQNKMKELELLCSLKEVPLNFSDLENVVLALRPVIKKILKDHCTNNVGHIV